ncbi:hypothetical protein [Cupriavidus sp.]|jgi:hypothetical protein|uniref:hypothetical protein n=1 Tax=Cupriavidus sp. TaxID=1873897 RepID=UPI0025C16FED|nr:hypothetical protein [Cupriavidus sp.]MCA3186304.1 hypothetical protein [Cupriavidus sp.]MCA3190946.1 hypothetical protein [Cupriavidus sp.]MCA3199290.1 hypothetical protein [Cupriavidus sp.]MCA3204557.1 hypothetical protein [Cupriavidus sp.]MCA3207744.1 hypothetical protein [Cupriavidus sp.]
MSAIRLGAPRVDIPLPRRPVMPAGVRQRTLRRPLGSSIVEIEFRGARREAVQAAAGQHISGIDAYRSPGVQSTRLDGAEWVCTLRYYDVN